MNELKKRHGCVTFWLWLLILGNLFSALYDSVLMFEAYNTEMSLGYGIIEILRIVNVLSAILLMRWNKRGFYMLLVSFILEGLVNIGLLGLSAVEALFLLPAILIWWGILQIRKNGVRAWALMSNSWDYKHCRHLYQVFIGIIIIMFILTMIASLGDHDVNPDKEINDDYDNIEIALDSVECETPISDEISWIVFKDTTNSVEVKAPSEFRKVKFNEDQILSLYCSDYDPAICVIQESVNDLEFAGVKTTKDYARLILKMVQNSGVTNYRKISEKPYGDSYIVEYELTLQGMNFYYKFIAKRTTRYFYYCQVYCLSEYQSKLQGQIDYMIESFNVLK